jgi:hypothetical protein
VKDEEAKHRATYEAMIKGDQPPWDALDEPTRERVRETNRKYWGWYAQYQELIAAGKLADAKQFAEGVLQNELDTAEDPLFMMLWTSNDHLFERLAPKFPGIETMRKLIWKCVCGEPDCFRYCVQGYAKKFPTPEIFGEWLDAIVGAQDLGDITTITHVFCRKHHIPPSQLMRDPGDDDMQKRSLN